MNPTNEMIKTAVIGLGYLGKFHAQKYLNLPQSELTAICDIQQHHNPTLEKQYGCAIFENHKILLELGVEAVSIASPTPSHFSLAKWALENGLHVLLEKPITQTIQEANTLIAIAEKNDLILQIGHLERFNPVIQSVIPFVKNPVWIQADRLATFKERGTEVSVVLDLMIHDIDLIRYFVNSPIKTLKAKGHSLKSSNIDIAYASLLFENGCMAHIQASRIHHHNQRTMNIVTAHDYLYLDLQNRHLSRQSVKNSTDIKQSFAQADPLNEEIITFLDTIKQKKPVTVSGKAGRLALETALAIENLIKNMH